jgi:hypothetical protein
MLCKAVIVARLFGIVPERFLLDKALQASTPKNIF